jgi:hypothetical protein
MGLQKYADAWIEDMNQNKVVIDKVQEKIFNVSQKNNKYVLSINYDDRLITFFKEYQYLEKMNLKIIASFKYQAREAMSNYPYAVSLKEILHCYNQITGKIDEKINKLIAYFRIDVHNQLMNGLPVHWTNKEQLPSYTKKLWALVLQLD